MYLSPLEQPLASLDIIAWIINIHSIHLFLANIFQFIDIDIFISYPIYWTEVVLQYISNFWFSSILTTFSTRNVNAICLTQLYTEQTTFDNWKALINEYLAAGIG